MRRRNPRPVGPGAIELIEEAAHLLRLSPLATLGCYYTGSLPFVLGFLYFWADMSRGATAYEHCAPAAFGVSALFLWMKTWQVIFCRRLKAQITSRPAPALTPRRFVRVAVGQSIIQPSGLFLLPLSALVLLPFGWVYAFYQNATAVGAEDGAEPKEVCRRAIRQAQLWPGQNHVMLGVLALFGAVVFLDVAIGLVQIPALLKTFLGIETAFTRSPWGFLNTTFVATVCGLTYLCLDPLIKALYLLRCFYGESLHSGEDLKAELRHFVPAGRIAGGVLALLLGASALNADAPSANPEPEARNSKPEISPSDLDHSIEQVLSRREFDWRLPREKPAEAKKGFLASFLEAVAETLRRWARAVARWIADAVDWLREKILGKRRYTPSGDSGVGWMAPLQTMVFVLLAAAASVAAILFYRTWLQRRRRVETISEAIAAIPDLADENVSASQLPEDEWLKLAGELIGRGELRPALRALYLASLAHLAQREMISVAKFKSNHDYERELRRRARALPDLQSAFGENVGIFERVWYGLHDVTQDALQRFQINLERIKAC